MVAPRALAIGVLPEASAPWHMAQRLVNTTFPAAGSPFAAARPLRAKAQGETKAATIITPTPVFMIKPPVDLLSRLLIITCAQIG
jgi:fructoselysine-6-P-deglycase FrlB-like protein